MANKKLGSTTSYARVVYWHYKYQTFAFASSLRVGLPDSSVMGVEEGFIEAEIESIDCQKSIRSAAGTFDITLLPSKNWRQFIAPGDWLAIYLYDEVSQFSYQNSNIVMLGSVDRVARVKQKDERTDKTIVRYHISGRDFGKVFEDTDVFFNPYNALNKILETTLISRGLAVKGGPSTLVNEFTDVFLSPNPTVIDDPANGQSRVDSLGQWRIPDEMSQLFGSPTGGGSFHDILKKDIAEDLPGYKPRSTLTTGSNGGLWGLLQRNSNDIANHLYCDLARDKNGQVAPTLFLKPIPTSPLFVDLPMSLKGTSKPLLDVADEDGTIDIFPSDIIFENVGRDGNYRFNMVWLTPALSDASGAVNAMSNTMNLAGIGLPMQCSESIERYGLKIMEKRLEFTYQDSKVETSLNINLYKSFINLVYDINAYLHCYETGSIEVSGKIDARLGRVLRVCGEDVGDDLASQALAKVSNPLRPKKLFFIDGYKHSWRFPGKWTTEFTVSMGQWDNKALPFIDQRFDDFGFPDYSFNESSLVQTNVDRPGKLEPSSASNIEGVINSVKGLA